MQKPLLTLAVLAAFGLSGCDPMVKTNAVSGPAVAGAAASPDSLPKEAPPTQTEPAPEAQPPMAEQEKGKVAEVPAKPEEPAVAASEPTPEGTEVAAAPAAPKAKPKKAAEKEDPTAFALAQIKAIKVKPSDWPQWGGSSHRNNTPEGKNIPIEWDFKTGKNIKASAYLGSQTYGNPVIANGKVFVGTNNGNGYIKRYPAQVDLGVLVCFEEETGKFLWQHSSEKLPQGRVNDWPKQGICCAPYIDGDRLWYVTSRGELDCLDTEGFMDKENDGPFVDEKPTKGDVEWEEAIEADVIWRLDMMQQLGVSQHNMCNCCVTVIGDIVFVNTSNGVDEAHINIPSPDAPSFCAVDKNTGKVLWADSSPGNNVLHGQWSSPAYGVFGDQPQVIFAGGDGWLYSFDPKGDNGKSKLLWKFDCNPKESFYALQRATRNHLIATPVIYDGYVYIAVGEDPEHGEGDGHLWCIDPTKLGDVSPTLVFNKKDPKTPIAAKRLKACVPEDGDFEQPNPNSAVVWHYEGKDKESDEFTDHMHRTCGTVAIKNDLLFVADFSGLFHCVDAKTGKLHWIYDLFAASWASPLIVENHVYISDEDGDIAIFDLSATPPTEETENDNRVVVQGTSRYPHQHMLTSVYTTPVVANNRLFIADKKMLFVIETGAQSTPLPEKDEVESSSSD